MCLVLSPGYIVLTLVMLVHVVAHLIMTPMVHHGASAMGVSVLMARMRIT
jgi:hypothetical protein